MDAKLFFEAAGYPILKDWITFKSSSEIEMALRLVKTQHFADWYKTHPQGTMDQYLNYRNQQIAAYYNSPQYQLESLRNQLGTLQNQLDDLNNDIAELKEEIQEKNDEIDDLNTSLNQANLRVSILGIVALCLLVFILRKYIFQLVKIIKG